MEKIKTLIVMYDTPYAKEYRGFDRHKGLYLMIGSRLFHTPLYKSRVQNLDLKDAIIVLMREPGKPFYQFKRLSLSSCRRETTGERKQRITSVKVRI